MREAGAAAQRHLGSGYHRRGGLRLLELLNEACAQADAEGEVRVVERLKDATAYATGKILRPDFDEKYPVTGSPVRDEELRQFMSKMLGSMYELAAFKAEDFLANHPEQMLMPC